VPRPRFWRAGLLSFLFVVRRAPSPNRSLLPIAVRPLISTIRCKALNIFIKVWYSLSVIRAQHLRRLPGFDVRTCQRSSAPFASRTGLRDVSTRFAPNSFPFKPLRTLLHSARTQPFCFQAFPNSLRKTTRGGGRCILQAKSFSPSSRRSFSSLFTLSTKSVSQLLCRQSVPHSFQELPVLHQQFPYWNSRPQSYVPPPRSGSLRSQGGDSSSQKPAKCPIIKAYVLSGRSAAW
jgi:hypothetical protein